MLKFFHAPRSIKISNSNSRSEITFEGSNEYSQGKIIPFSHVYLTSMSQFSQFFRLMEKHGDKGALVLLHEAAVESILSARECPVNLSFQDVGIEQVLRQSGLDRADRIRVVVINGMGTAYGDNIVGLGALQHFQKYLVRKFGRVQIDLVLRNRVVQQTIYSRYDIVQRILQLPITVSRFYEYDAYIDMSDILLNPDFDTCSMMDCCLRARSMQKEITEQKDKKTSLNVPWDKVTAIRQEIINRSASKNPDQKIVMLHPKASSPHRTMPDSEVRRLLGELISHTQMLFVHCVPISFSHERVIDMSDLSSGFNELSDIIAATDAVITVGTSVYHVSGNLDIPTFLIPTVVADTRSAFHLPSVSNIVPEYLLVHLSSRHKSAKGEDMQRANLIWQSIKGEEVAERLNNALTGSQT